jgi:hypothetical protein
LQCLDIGRPCIDSRLRNEVIVQKDEESDKKNEYIEKSKIILNIHFYEETGLETCRINEILNYNKLIISEKSILDRKNMDLYKKLIIFTDEIKDDLSNINDLIQILNYFLDKNKYTKQINKITHHLEKLEKNIDKCIVIS